MNKKALVNLKIIYLLISAIILILTISYIVNSLDDFTYSSSIVQCENLFKSIGGSTKFFGNNLDGLTNNFFQVVEATCSAKDVNIKDGSLNNAVKLVNDCHNKAGKGLEIFEGTEEGLSFCIYCGLIKSNDEITDFDDQFVNRINQYEELKDSKDNILNFNDESLFNKDNIPSTISEGNDLMVLFYASKPGEDLGSVKKFFKGVGDFLTGNYQKTISGVIISPWERTNDIGELKLNPQSFNSEESLNCPLIVPDKIYD